MKLLTNYIGHTILLISLVVFISCGSSNKDKVKIAKLNSLYEMSHNNCDDAISILDKVGYQNRDAEFIKIYASALACRGGFSAINFLLDDINRISTGSFLSIISTFESSNVPSITSSEVQELERSNNLLLYAGGISSSSYANRGVIFTDSQNSSIGVQAIMQLIVQLGRYSYHYGNTDANGVKGARNTAANSCITDYTTANAQAAMAALRTTNSVGNCATNNDGHADLKDGITERRARLCQLISTMNNISDILTNINFSEDIENINNVPNLSQVCTNLSVGAVCSVTDAQTCTNSTATYPIEHLEIYIAIVMEQLLI